MKIIVTGGLGLVGSEIVRQLAESHEVWAVDDLSHNAVEPLTSAAGHLYISDVRDMMDMFPYGYLPDLIIHCASPVGPALLTPEADVAWRIISQTRKMVEMAAATDIRLIVMSTSEVTTYAGETDIRAQYALGKLVGEAMVLGHPSLDGRVIRPYNVTGRHQRADSGLVMARFREQIRNSQPLTVFGSGVQSRCFTHVSDFAQFVRLLAEKWPERKVWSVFNAGNNCRIIDLAEMFVRQAGAGAVVARRLDGRVELANAQWRDTPERRLNQEDSDACYALGWRPQVGLEGIVREHLTGELCREAGS